MGIAIDYDAIPESTPQPVLFVSRDIDAERQIAAAFLGELEARDEGGGIYHYESPRGQVQFRGGSFRFELADWQSGSDRGEANRLLAELGVSLDRAEESIGADDDSLTLPLWVDGLAVLGSQGRFHFSDGDLQIISGTSLWGTRQGYDAGSQLDVTTALINLAGHVQNLGTVTRFERVEMGYALLEGPGYIELRPIWIVYVDDWDWYVFSVDRQRGGIR